MVKEFLPAMRGLVAHELASRSLSQGKIARMIGVTQAAVSQYLDHTKENYSSKTKLLGLSGEEAERYAKLLCEDLSVSPIEGIQTLYTIWRNLLAQGVFCPSHQAMSPIPKECDVCMRLFGPVKIDDNKGTVLRQMENARKLLETSPFFSHIMPEVSVNLVMCPQDAKNESEVAGFPGRITKVHGRARAMLPPEFGASRHMAHMLLIARSRNKEIGAGIDVKYDQKIAMALEDMKLKTIRTTDKHRAKRGAADVVVDAFSTAVERAEGPFTAVVDEGGPGLEPITYVFGSDALEVCETVLELASRYGKS
ncbi:MAG: hypothetical protein HY619_00420 [Thaumarchaeota archaeon]|nr:hypothetical protein [Nitrososphaerota archaeon]